jgi:hypothetical protein
MSKDDIKKLEDIAIEGMPASSKKAISRSASVIPTA